MRFLIFLFICLEVFSVPVTKTIGTASRDYSTVTLWEADLDDSIIYSSGDDAVGEMYNDSTFDEQVIINSGITIGLNSITLTVPVSERHDGTAGTGARVVFSSGGGSFILSNSSNDKVFEWFEVDVNDKDLGGGGNAGIKVDSNANVVVRNTIVHNVIEGSAENGGISARTLQSVDILNNIVYSIKSTHTGGNGVFGIRTEENVSDVYNNTVFNVVNDNGTGFAIGIQYEDTTTTNMRNNISMDMSGSSSGGQTDFNPSSPANATVSNNLSSDTTATGTGSLVSKTSGNQFVSTTAGSEDLHLKTGADAIDAGTDLGTTPTGVNFDIDNRDRDAEVDTWDMGADEFVAVTGGVARRIMLVG